MALPGPGEPPHVAERRQPRHHRVEHRPLERRPRREVRLPGWDCPECGHVEPVSVGIFLKRPEKVAELRPLTKWVAIAFPLPRRAQHPRITRKPMPWGRGWWHVANARDAADVDEALLDLLEEAYHFAGSS